MSGFSSVGFSMVGGVREKLWVGDTLTKEEDSGWRPLPEILSEDRFAFTCAFWLTGINWENTRLLSTPSCLTDPIVWPGLGTVYATALGARELKKTFPCWTVADSLVNVLPSEVLEFTEILPKKKKKYRLSLMGLIRKEKSYFLHTWFFSGFIESPWALKTTDFKTPLLRIYLSDSVNPRTGIFLTPWVILVMKREQELLA